MKKFVSALLTLSLVLALAACGQSDTVDQDAYDVTTVSATETTERATTVAATEAETTTEAVVEVSKYPMTLTDKFGNEVVIEAAPERIISMSPEITEILYGLGAGERLIGRSSYCDYPAETADVQDFGSLFDLNVESIVAAQPDVIFLSSMASEDLVNMLVSNSLTVVTLDKDSTLDGTYEYFSLLGSIIDKEKEAAELIESIKAQIADVQVKVAGLETPRVYYVVYAGEGYDSTATGDTFIHDMIVTAGGDNVAKDGEFWSYSVEKLVEQDPYMMFCSQLWETKAKIQGLEGYKELTAVQEDRLYEVDENIFSRQGPRVGEAVQVLAELMHPEAFQ